MCHTSHLTYRVWCNETQQSIQLVVTKPYRFDNGMTLAFSLSVHLEAYQQQNNGNYAYVENITFY